MAQQTFNNTKINVEFDESTSRQQLNSGENISTLFGKIKKIFSDLKSVCFSGSYKDLSDKPTTATKDTNGLMSASDKTKLDNADNTYALKSKYGDTTINVGRKAGTDVGGYSTAEGYNTTASGYTSHAEGSNAYISNGEIAFYDTRTVMINDDVTVEVDSSQAYGANSHAEGCQTLAYGNYSHAEGHQTAASGSSSHAEGDQTTASGGDSHAEGYKTIASGAQSHAEGVTTTASGGRSHAEGSETIASGGFCHAEGWRTTANGNNSCHAEGSKTTASGIATHAEGNSSNKVTDLITDFSWNYTTNDDIINVWNTQKFSLAHGRVSHVEGSDNLTLGHSSHAEGCCTVAIGSQSHTSGYYTKALHENEAAYGQYNQSNDNTLFSIGDGTADDARHNAFEITTTGGKLHDKDIATTDLIPTSLPANGGNADTVDGLHADDFVIANDRSNTQIPNNADVPAWIHANCKRYKIYMTNGANKGMTNIPNNTTDYVWYWYDGINIIAREWATGRYYICDVINGGFSGWKDIYTSGYKPYVTGDVPISEDGKCYTNHGFTPSVILYNLPYTTATLFDNVRKATTFDTTSFTPSSGAIGATINYIIFK